MIETTHNIRFDVDLTRSSLCARRQSAVQAHEQNPEVLICVRCKKEMRLRRRKQDRESSSEDRLVHQLLVSMP